MPLHLSWLYDATGGLKTQGSRSCSIQGSYPSLVTRTLRPLTQALRLANNVRHAGRTDAKELRDSCIGELVGLVQLDNGCSSRGVDLWATGFMPSVRNGLPHILPGSALINVARPYAQGGVAPVANIAARRWPPAMLQEERNDMRSLHRAVDVGRDYAVALPFQLVVMPVAGAGPEPARAEIRAAGWDGAVLIDLGPEAVSKWSRDRTEFMASCHAHADVSACYH